MVSEGLEGVSGVWEIGGCTHGDWQGECLEGQTARRTGYYRGRSGSVTKSVGNRARPRGLRKRWLKTASQSVVSTHDP